MRYQHIPGVVVAAEFDPTRSFRYRLEIVKPDVSPPGKTACVVMQNPSYASESVADKSVQFMEKVVFLRGLSEFQGVRRLIVVNQYARIQTHGFLGLPEDIGPLNDAAIARALHESEIIILAWGAANRFQERQGFVYQLLASLPGKQLYRTRLHPSRGRYAGFILPEDGARPAGAGG